MFRRSSSLDEKYLQFISSIFFLLAVFYHEYRPWQGRDHRQRFTVCYRRPERGLQSTVKSGVWKPAQVDIHLGLTPSPADEDEVDVLAFDVVVSIHDEASKHPWSVQIRVDKRS